MLKGLELTRQDVIPEPIPISEALERRKQKREHVCICRKYTQNVSVAIDDNPTLHEDGVVAAPQVLVDDNLPPLIPSTNPLYPNAIVKKPPNTHAKTSMKPKEAKKTDEPVLPPPAADSASPIVPAAKPLPVSLAPSRVDRTVLIGRSRRPLIH